MEIAKMLNTTILACLLILTGCLGLGTDGDVIDDAQGDDGHDDSGSTTIMNAYPPVQSTIMGNGSITVAAGEYVEILNLYLPEETNQYYDTKNTASTMFDYNCGSFSGTVHITIDAGGNFLPNDGTGCSYIVNDYYEVNGTLQYHIIYRVW
jgi:hypothetical protein